MSDSPGLVDFAIGLVNSVINLPDGQVKFSEEFKLQKNCGINLPIKTCLGLVEMMFSLINVSFSLPKWQALKMTYFAPWTKTHCFPRVLFLLRPCPHVSGNFFFRKYFFADAKIFASTRSVFESFSAVHTYPIVSGNFLICSSAQFFCRRESWNEHAHNCDLGAISFAP